MNDNRFDRILDDVWREVKDLETGILYKTIFILDRENARDICQFFEIKENARRYEDLQVLNQIKSLNNPLDTPMKPIIEANDSLNEPLSSLAENNPGNGWIQFLNHIKPKIPNDFIIPSIIVTALAVIALFYVLNSRKRSSHQERSSRSTTIDNSTSDAILCLAVPIGRIDPELKKILVLESKLTVEEIKLLIDKSVYFIACEESKVDDYNRKALNLSEESIEYAEIGDVYIQLYVPNGKDIIGQDLKRSLSRNLPDCKATIEDIAILNDLTNIDRFHRA